MLTRLWALLLVGMIAFPVSANTKPLTQLTPEQVMDEALARDDKAQDKKKEKKYVKKNIKKPSKNTKKKESDEGRTMPRDISKL